MISSGEKARKHVKNIHSPFGPAVVVASSPRFRANLDETLRIDRGRTRRNKDEENEGMKARRKKGRKSKKRGRQCRLTAGVCLPVRSFLILLLLFLSLSCISSSISTLSPSLISSRETIPTLTRLFVLSHSPRSGEHELPYSGVTSGDQLIQMTSNESRAHARLAAAV